MKTDVQVKGDVLAELKWDPEIDESKIGVVVNGGAVTLTGHVPTYRQKIAATAAAKRMAGVLAIVDEIEVRLPTDHRATDEGLAERIANVLRWNVSNQLPGIQAEVKNGVVTLSGMVDWQYQRSNILKNVEHVRGVVDVVSLIGLKPRISTVDVQNRIMDALKRHANIESSKIQVIALDGIVTLNGTVESMEEMNRVEDAAWTAPGVARVIDNLRVA